MITAIMKGGMELIIYSQTAIKVSTHRCLPICSQLARAMLCY